MDLKDYYLLELLLLFVKIFWILIVVKDREKMFGDIDLYVSFQIRFRRSYSLGLLSILKEDVC
jgi:hypothetical protein